MPEDALVDVDAFCRMALSLPESVEQDHHGFPSFRVAGNIFATMPDVGFVHLMLPEDDIREAVALDPAACSEKWWGKRLAALRVSLADVDEDALEQLLRDAWTSKATKKRARS